MIDRRRSLPRIALAFAAALVLFTGFADSHAQVVRQVTDVGTGETTLGALDDAGAKVFAISASDPYGTNPAHRYHIFEWNADTGDGRQVTFFHDSILPNDIGPSVSDDGSLLAFLSAGNHAGANPDGSMELFVINADGSGLLQLTDAASSCDGEFTWIDLSGDGSRAVFGSSVDYLGQNSTGMTTFFVIDTDGTGLTQLLTPTGFAWWPSISDDGERVVFSMDGTIYAVDADGSNLRQLTSLAGSSEHPRISGDGTTVVFQTSSTELPDNPNFYGCSGATQIGAIDWDGGNLTQLAAPCLGASYPGDTQLPDLTDDGTVIFYTGNDLYSASLWAMWKVNRDGSGTTLLTDLYNEPPPHANCYWSRACGSGARVAFNCWGGEPYGGPNLDLSRELYAGTGAGTNFRQLSDGIIGYSVEPDLTSTGDRIVFASDANPLDEGTSPGAQIYRIEEDGSDLVRLTGFTDRTPAEPAISDDGSRVVFAAEEIWLVLADGTGPFALTPPGTCEAPDISGNGAAVVFVSRENFTGENPSGADAIYKVLPDGSGLDQIARGTMPRIDAGGAWVAYKELSIWSDGPIRRVLSNGANDQLVSTVDGYHPDISANGRRIVYESEGDPLGTNPEGNREIFLWDAITTTTTQLTMTTSGDNTSPAISGDGAYVYFISTGPLSDANCEERRDLFRVDMATRTVERVGALRCLLVRDYPPGTRFVKADGDGSRAVFSGEDCSGDNPDLLHEVFLIDRDAPASVRVSPGPAPTVISWSAESGPLRYDVIRGDVADLAVAGSNADLGEVVCIEDESIDLDTVGFEDTADPAAGEAFFYLYRGSPGSLAGPGSYGQGSLARERIVATGDCL